MNQYSIYVIVILAFHNFSPICGFVDTHTFIHNVFLDSENKFLLKWTPRDDDIIFEIEVNTGGYAGLGFSPSGFMKGSDIIVAWIDNDGFPFLSDRHAISNSKPLKDASQDWSLLGGSRNDSHIAIRFTRKWKTCDADDFELNGDTMRVIWAYHPRIPERTIDDYIFHRHTERGMRSLLLADNHDVKEPTSPDVKYFDIRARNVTLPADKHSVYLCHLEKVPTFEKKQHVIGIKPILDDKNQNYVHHIVIYECRASDIEVLEKLVEHPSVECYADGVPPQWQMCQAVIFAWAVGSEGEMFPQSAGIPIGGGKSQYYLIEIHYDNPKYERDIVDDSGLRLYYTDKLRQYDSAMLTIGHSYSDFQVIPPGVASWTSLSYCFSDCLSRDFPEKGINITSVMLHTHLTGRAVTVRVYRNGQEVPLLSKDGHYDFDYQQSRVLKVERTILPGDQFVINCTYDTRDRNYLTLGGLNTKEELCYAFLMYYPMVKTTECASYPTIDVYEDVFGLKTEISLHQNSSLSGQNFSSSDNGKKEYLKDFVVLDSKGHANGSVLAYLHDIAKFKPRKFNDLQDAILSNKYKYTQECIANEGSVTQAKFTEITIPELIPMAEKPKEICPATPVVPRLKIPRRNNNKISSAAQNLPIMTYSLICIVYAIKQV